MMKKIFPADKQFTQSHRGNLGLSLVEILVALLIGFTLVTGVITLVVNAQQSNRVLSSINIQHDNGRVALSILADAAIHSGHWAGVKPTSITPATSLSINASGSCDVSWFTNVSRSLQGYDGASTMSNTSFPSSCISDADYVPNTDILVVRYADPNYAIESSKVTNASYQNDILIRTILDDAASGSSALIFPANNGIPAGITTGNDPGKYNFIYRSDVYFITTCCDDNRPALARLRYDGSAFQIEILVEHVEQLQLAYGSDTDDDLTVDRFDPAGSVPNWSNVISISIDLVVRNDKRSPEFTDDAAYNLAGSYTFSVANAVKKYRRKVYSKIVSVRNSNRS